MKYTLLLRHAKSSHDNPDLRDYDRPLAPRGERDAPRMGRFIRGIDFRPAAVISSPALRARQTTEHFLAGADVPDQRVQWNEDFYYGSYADYLEALQQADEEIDIVMLVGHNPKMETLAGRLIGDGAVRMPTAGLACFEHRVSRWDQIREGTASLKWLMIPEMLNGMG